MPAERNETRSEAGPEGGDGEVGGIDLAQQVEQLEADPEALREYVLRQAAEIIELRRKNERLERFRALALDAVESLAEAGRRAS